MDGVMYSSLSASSVTILFYVGVSTLLTILFPILAIKSQLLMIAHIDALMLFGSEMKESHLLIVFVTGVL